MIAREEELARPFAAGLERCRGTLAVSWANIGEFRNVRNPEQARECERFIDMNLPRVFCIEVNPFTVIEREQRGVPSPASDDDALRVLAGLRSDPFKEVGANGLFTIMMGRLVESGERLAAIFVEQYERLSAEFGSDESFRDLVRRTPKSAATLSVLREIMAAYLKDRNWKADSHDVMDFFHAVVPTVYCQWVLLDKDWAEHVRRAQAAVRKAAVDEPMATVLTKREGVECLLAGLEQA